MDKLTIMEIKEKAPLLEWLMVLASVCKDKNVRNIWPELPKDGKWKIQLIINDVELPAVEAFEEIRKQHERMIKEDAVKLLRDNFHDLNNIIEDITQSIVNDFSSKFGVEIEDS